MLYNAVPAAAQVAKLFPVDQSQEDPSFYVFRFRLINAIVMRDTSFLYQHLAPDVKTGFGGEAGPSDFKRQWKASEPGTRLWATLADVVAGGGTFGGGGEHQFFEAPYWSSVWDGGAYDPFQHGVIVGERVNVRSSPSVNGEIVATLSYDIIPIVDISPAEDRSGMWARIRLANGTHGYVHRRYLRSPIGYRIAFAKVDEEWKIRWFLAGD